MIEKVNNENVRISAHYPAYHGSVRYVYKGEIEDIQSRCHLVFGFTPSWEEIDAVLQTMPLDKLTTDSVAAEVASRRADAPSPPQDAPVQHVRVPLTDGPQVGAVSLRENPYEWMIQERNRLRAACVSPGVRLGIVWERPREPNVESIGDPAFSVYLQPEGAHCPDPRLIRHVWMDPGDRFLPEAQLRDNLERVVDTQVRELLAIHEAMQSDRAKDYTSPPGTPTL